MKLYQSIILIFVAAFVFMLSCDKVDEPYGSKVPGPPPECEPVNFPEFSQDTLNKVILFEEITGHRCPNCPDGHEILEDLGAQYGDQLAIAAFHVGTTAIPGNDPFDVDYRTEDGDEIVASFIQNPAAPTALINRTLNGTVMTYNTSDWENKVNELLQQSPDAYLQMINVMDSVVENEFCCHVQTTLFSSFTKDLSLNIYLVEDSLISGQFVHSSVVSDYVHKHVFRKALLDVSGIPLGVKNEGETEVSTYKFVVDDAWEIEHCSLIAFITNSENDEVVQAVVEHLGH